ncbi:MAG: 50S ribosomal protein L11 methyltransferase [Balneolaceae bacterium]
MKYIQLEFMLPDSIHEQFIAELAEMDFYGFEQFDNRLVAYIETPRYNDSNRELIEQLVSLVPDASFCEKDQIEEKNWNEAWEQTIQPQRVGQFFIKPTWSLEEPESGEILLEIDPKMAFGTGYHATTRLILRQLSKIDFRQKMVMDAGTGTGILAIASVKLGAQKAIGFDIDPWSKNNAYENAMINGVSEQVYIRFGSLDQIKPEEFFDITLANINRNIILDLIPFFVEKTKISGSICLTGLLISDEEVIREKLQNEPVDIIDIQTEEEWILFHLIKREIL